MTDHHAAMDEIVAAHWATSDLINFTMTFNAIDSRDPIWTSIASERPSARTFFTTADAEEAREAAAEALALGGWTVWSIGQVKS